MSNAGVRLIINESWVCVADAEGQTGQPSAIIKGKVWCKLILHQKVA